jgi:hypothetical protein
MCSVNFDAYGHKAGLLVGDVHGTGRLEKALLLLMQGSEAGMVDLEVRGPEAGMVDLEVPVWWTPSIITASFHFFCFPIPNRR